MKLQERSFSPSTALQLIKAGYGSVISRVLAARGISSVEQANLGLSKLLPYSGLKGIAEITQILADAIETKKRLLIVSDYDADGATACAIGMRALRSFGANVGFLIPKRLEHGYGLTPDIVQIAASLSPRPDYIITVDNGISSFDGIALANELGIPVLVTDHHLPGATHPPAKVIVNPNQHGCPFPSKALAGCGVMYYVMWALQDELKQRGVPFSASDFDVTQLLPIVAVGTIADVVALDTNNRILVGQGLKRIRSGAAQPGIEALIRVSGKQAEQLTTTDIAFGIGPRINAAGRLETMDAGVECLITDDSARAEELAKELHEINMRRREIEIEMTEEALFDLNFDIPEDTFSVVVHRQAWHQGVIGIVAGRIKERFWRPTFALADGGNNLLKGSGRSIPGLHLRDALDLVDKRCPGLLVKFGGHAMAAGITISADRLNEFKEAFEAVCKQLLAPEHLQQTILYDGELDKSELTLSTVYELKRYVWGQGFPEPVFRGKFKVKDVRPIGDGSHIRVALEKEGVFYSGVRFRHTGEMPSGYVDIIYKLETNTWNDETRLQLMIEHFV